MRIFLGFRHAQLRAMRVGDDLAEDVGKVLRREDRRHQSVELFAVLRHTDSGGNLHRPLARETIEGGIEHRAQNLAHAVGAEIEAQHAVTVLHASVIADHGRQDEFVVDLVGVGIGDRRLPFSRRMELARIG